MCNWSINMPTRGPTPVGEHQLHGDMICNIRARDATVLARENTFCRQKIDEEIERETDRERERERERDGGGRERI